MQIKKSRIQKHSKPYIKDELYFVRGMLMSLEQKRFHLYAFKNGKALKYGFTISLKNPPALHCGIFIFL